MRHDRVCVNVTRFRHPSSQNQSARASLFRYRGKLEPEVPVVYTWYHEWSGFIRRRRDCCSIVGESRCRAPGLRRHHHTLRSRRRQVSSRGSSRRSTVRQDPLLSQPDRPLTRDLTGLKARAAWITADQTLSSLSNAGLAILLARVVSPSEYGAFALAFSIYTLVVSLIQSASGQVMVIRYSGKDRQTQVGAGAGAAGTAIIMGALTAILTVAMGLLYGEPQRLVLVILGVLLPALVLQDTWRSVFVARGEPKMSFINDLLWITLQAIGTTILLHQEVRSVSAYVYRVGYIGCDCSAPGLPTKPPPAHFPDHKTLANKPPRGQPSISCRRASSPRFHASCVHIDRDCRNH